MPLTGTYKPRSFYFGGTGFLDFTVGLIGGVVLFIVSMIVGLVVDAAISASYRVPHVNLQQRRIRVGRKSMTFEKIAEARVVDHGFTRSGEPELHISGGSLTIAMPVLSRGGLHPFPSHATMVTILEASSIVIPTSQYDPKGRFERFNFPNHVTKAGAIDLVRNPPRSKTGLPTPRS